MAERLNGQLIIDDSSYKEVLGTTIDGVLMGTGAVPRDYTVDPVEMFEPPSAIKLIPRSEWSARIKEMEETKSRLSDVRGGIPSLNQGPVGYCWGHSTVHDVILLRALSNQPYVPLSAYAVAAIIKGGRDEGGWCGLSAKFLKEVGVPSQDFWPQGNRSLSLDTPEMRANAALHKVTEEWMDLTRPVYANDMTFDMVMSCLLARTPATGDFNWWGHSVCLLDPVEVERGSFGIRIWNSWGDEWEDRGMAILRGSKAIPDGAVALRVTGASDK